MRLFLLLPATLLLPQSILLVLLRHWTSIPSWLILTQHHAQQDMGSKGRR